jgi:hypothetical protein
VPLLNIGVARTVPAVGRQLIKTKYPSFLRLVFLIFALPDAPKEEEMSKRTEKKGIRRKFDRQVIKGNLEDTKGGKILKPKVAGSIVGKETGHWEAVYICT